MKLRINDEDVEFADGGSVADLLVAQKVSMPDMVSVELNGTILDRKTFGETILKEGDRVEFLYFMGGGAGRRAGGVRRV